MADQVDKPPEPKSTPEEKQVSEVTESTSDSSTEVRSDESAKMESELGRLRQELGDERKKAEELNAYKLWYDQNAARMQQQPQQQVPQQPAPNLDEQFFDKPTETVQKILSQYEMKRQYQEAYQSAPSAFAQAKMMYPDRFEGVDENMVQQIMYAPVQQGQMNPNVLKDPNLWAGAAWIAKGAQTQYKMPDPGLNPMNPLQDETPGRSRSNEDRETPEIRGDDLTAVFMDKLEQAGMKKEDIPKEVQATREEEG